MTDISEVYGERDQLVAALSKVFPAHISRHQGEGEWDEEWMNVVCVHLPTGQVAWHIRDAELPWFNHLERLPGHYDGHTTEEKYARLALLGVISDVVYQL